MRFFGLLYGLMRFSNFKNLSPAFGTWYSLVQKQTKVAVSGTRNMVFLFGIKTNFNVKKARRKTAHQRIGPKLELNPERTQHIQI